MPKRSNKYANQHKFEIRVIASTFYRITPERFVVETCCSHLSLTPSFLSTKRTITGVIFIGPILLSWKSLESLEKKFIHWLIGS